MVALASSPAVPRAPRPPLALSTTASVIKTEQLRRSYNGRVLFTLRDFRREDFETLWRIDQSCFPPGISYGRLELSAYIRRRGAFTLVAESAESGQAERGEIAKPAPSILGFIVAEASRRGMGISSPLTLCCQLGASVLVPGCLLPLKNDCKAKALLKCSLKQRWTTRQPWLSTS